MKMGKKEYKVFFKIDYSGRTGMVEGWCAETNTDKGVDFK
jgi:hypothetical protein